jgi:hypothetical protein
VALDGVSGLGIALPGLMNKPSCSSRFIASAPIDGFFDVLISNGHFRPRTPLGPAIISRTFFQGSAKGAGNGVPAFGGKADIGT